MANPTHSSSGLTRRQVLTAGAALAVPVRGDESKAIYLSDMSRALPRSALATKPAPKRWRLIDYETEAFKGVMAVAGQNSDAPEITLPLGRSGWHAISIGVFPHIVEHIFQNQQRATDDQFRVQVRLKSERTFSLLTHKGGERERIDDFFWKYADLTGEDLVLRQFNLQVFPETEKSTGRIGSSCWIAYVKLVPLSAPEVETLQREKGRSQRLFAHCDGFDPLYYYGVRTEGEIRRELEPYRNSDFSRIYWEAAHGDICNYPTRIGRTHEKQWMSDHYSVGDRINAESWAALRKNGIDAFKVACDYAHELGLEFHAGLRTAGFHFDPPWDQWTVDNIYDKHPEWRGVDRQGRPTPRLSYAYPEVHQYIVSLLEEIVTMYPVDGVCLLYNRRPPIVEYEPPLVEEFRRKYGEDARKVDERDPRWLNVRAGALTRFMRAVRTSMNRKAEQQRRARPFEVSAIVAGSERENLFYGMDLTAWVREGLVDTLMPYTSAEGGGSMADAWANPRDVDFFVNLTRGTRVKMAPNLLPRQLSPEQYRTRAHGLYERGVEQLFFWDTNQRTYLYPSWTEISRLGHREDLARWVASGSPRVERPGKKVTKLGDWVMGYATPG